MTSKLIRATYLTGHSVQLDFADGTGGPVDLTGELAGEIFLPLLDVSYFRSFRLNTETNIIEWPNGADFAPEFLYERALHSFSGRIKG